MAATGGTAAAMTAVAATFQGYQQIQKGNYQNKVAKYNARVAENEATQVRNKGNEAENIHREKTAQLQSRQRAQLGAAGVDLESGSALQLQTDTDTLGEVDALRIRSNTDDQVTALDQQASLLRDQGRNAKRAGLTQGVGSILGGVVGSGVASKWFTPSSSASLANGYTGESTTLGL
jgi:hypothetical protein